MDRLRIKRHKLDIDINNLEDRINLLKEERKGIHEAIIVLMQEDAENKEFKKTKVEFHENNGFE